jgi:type IV fimbrial biogenesis protein FimT
MYKPHGVTLPELLIVIAIVGILATLAVPSFQRVIQANAISSGVDIFMADLRFARSESIKRGGGVVMCRSNAPEASSPTCGTGSTLGWQSGWIIFHDLNNNSNKTATETLLRVQAPFPAIDSIAEAGAATKFKFSPTGRLTLTASTSLQFGGKKVANDLQRVVCVNLSGRARIAGDGTKSCASDQ